MNNNVINFPTREERNCNKNKEKIELIDFKPKEIEAKSFKSVDFPKIKEPSKKVQKVHKNNKNIMVKVIKSLMLLIIIFKKLFKKKSIRTFVVMPTVAFVLLIMGMVFFNKKEEVTVSPVNETANAESVEEKSVAESLNSEMNAKFNGDVVTDSTEESNSLNITEDIVIKLNPKIQGSVISSGYILDVKVVLPKDKVSLENNTLEFKDKDLEFTLLAINPNISDAELEIMDSEVIEDMYSEMESLRKKAIKEISKDKEVLDKVTETINDSLVN